MKTLKGKTNSLLVASQVIFPSSLHCYLLLVLYFYLIQYKVFFLLFIILGLSKQWISKCKIRVPVQ